MKISEKILTAIIEEAKRQNRSLRFVSLKAGFSETFIRDAKSAVGLNVDAAFKLAAVLRFDLKPVLFPAAQSAEAGDCANQLHRNGREREPLAIASLAEIETEIADVLDVMDRVADEETGALYQLAEAVRGLSWCVGSLGKHHENLSVALVERRDHD